MLGLSLVVLFLLLAAIGPLIVPYPEAASGAINMSAKLQPPSSTYWFGTDEMGADIFSRVIIGARTSLWIGVVITGIAAIVGITLGIIAGYRGGWVRAVIMRVTELFLAVPGLALALAIVAALGPGITNCVLALAIVWWPGYVRLVEAKTLSIKEELFIESARSIGAKTPWILWHHILPNCMSPIIVKMSMDMGMAILSAASLGFIGLGAQPPSPEWGAMIATAKRFIFEQWWVAAIPGIAIFCVSLAFNFLGDALRDVLDPKGN